MNPDNQPAPRGEPDRSTSGANLGGMSAEFMSRWLERPVPADRITQAILNNSTTNDRAPIDPTIFATLKTEVLRRIHTTNSRFAGGLPEELRCVVSSAFIPAEFRFGQTAIPNRLSDAHPPAPRRYSICCHLRNSAGQYVAYHHGGGFAFSRDHLPGESESPAAVNVFSVIITDSEHQRFIAIPRSFPIRQTTFCNRPAFREQLDYILAGGVLREPRSQFEPPAWSDIRSQLMSFLGPTRKIFRVERIRPFTYATGPGEFVCDTNHGALWVRATLSETTRPFEVEFKVRWEVDAVRRYLEPPQAGV
jgi:hypothetical protein